MGQIDLGFDLVWFGARGTRATATALLAAFKLRTDLFRFKVLQRT